MDYEQLKAHVIAYFGDTSRPASETKEGLLALAEECETLAETIDADD